jgi:uncharacterized membrane protein
MRPQLGAMLIALIFFAVTLSTPRAQQSPAQTLGVPHPEDIRSIESVSEVEPTETVVQVVAVTAEGERITLEMDNSTADTLAAEISNLEMEPYGAP